MAGWRTDASRRARSSNERTNSGQSAIWSRYDAHGDISLDPGQAGGEDDAVATGAEPLTQPIPAQREPRRLGEQQRRIVAEHPSLQLDECGRRLEAELLDEHVAVLAVDGECVGMATGAVEGDHQLRPEPLAQLVRADQRLDLRDRLDRPTTRQLRLDEALRGDQPQLLQALRLRADPVLVGELCVGVATPQTERLAQHRRCAGRVAASEPRTGVGDETFEAGDIERLVRQPQQVPGRLGDHHRGRPVGVDHLADPRHVAAQRRARRRRGRTGEHRLGEPVHRHHGVAMDQQHRQQPALTLAADAHLFALLADGQPAQRMKPDHPLTPPAEDPISRLQQTLRQGCGNPVAAGCVHAASRSASSRRYSPIRRSLSSS